MLWRIIKILLMPFMWFFNSTEIDAKYINAFTDWFGSIPAFKQQVAFMLIWVVIILAKPELDPNMFHLMAFLTIYSAITQPMLAFGNTRSNALITQLLKNTLHMMQALMDVISTLEKTLGEIKKMQQQLLEMQQSDAKQIDEIDNAVEKIVETIEKTNENPKD